MSANPQEYLLPELEKEVARLTEQDALITYHLDGKRILAPADLTQPGLQIHKMAQPLLAKPYVLYGFDIMPAFFPKDILPNTTLVIQDFTVPWSEDLDGKFDLVHQRVTLLGGGMKTTPASASACWPSSSKPLVGPSSTRWTSRGRLRADPPHMAPGKPFRPSSPPSAPVTILPITWPSDCTREGFKNVKEEYQKIGIGPLCKDPDWGTRSAQVMMNAILGAVGGIGMIKIPIDESIVASLPAHAEEEWKNESASYNIIYAIGQKPDA